MSEPVDPEDPFGVGKAVNELEAALLRHAKGCKSPDCNEEMDVIAFLAHKAGLRSNNLKPLIASMIDYETACPDCKHMRN